MLRKNTYRPGWRRESSSTSWWGQESQDSEKLRLGSKVASHLRSGVHVTGGHRELRNQTTCRSVRQVLGKLDRNLPGDPVEGGLRGANRCCELFLARLQERTRY